MKHNNDSQNELFPDVADDSILDHIDQHLEHISEKWPTMMMTMINTILDIRKQQGATEDEAKRDSLEITRALCRVLGGVQTYLPTGEKLERAIRNHSIWLEFDGNNMSKLTHKYKLSHVSMYKIIGQQRKLHQKSRESDLFG